MDQFVSQKWNGLNETNCTIFDYSLGSQIINDPHGFFTSEKMPSELYEHFCKYDKSNMTHKFKFFSWKKSMSIRFMFTGIITILLTLLF